MYANLNRINKKNRKNVNHKKPSRDNGYELLKV